MRRARSFGVLKAFAACLTDCLSCSPVFAKEPTDPKDPLLALDNVTLTAHAGYNTPEAAMTMYRRAIDLAKGG